MSPAFFAIIDWDELSELDGQKVGKFGQVVLLCELEQAQKFGFPSDVIFNGCHGIGDQPQSKLSHGNFFSLVQGTVRDVFVTELSEDKIGCRTPCFQNSPVKDDGGFHLRRREASNVASNPFNCDFLAHERTGW